MTLAQGLLVGVLLLGVAYWLVTGALGLRALSTMPVLADLRPRDPARWPSLSVVVPARNEASTLEAAVATRIAQDYPALELVLVDDRSTDATPALVDRLAAGDARVKALHVTELPEGWLGKLHALHCGAGAARGEWLLFTDADVHFAPGTLRRAVAHCEERGLDFLTAMPEFRPKERWLDAVVSSFVRIIAGAAQASAVEDPSSRASVGGGVFNLVRRSVFERSQGFSWLRLEVADDAALGQMMKSAGARCSVVNARGMIALHFYESLGAMAGGCEKAGFALVGRFSHARLILTSLLFLTLELSPFLALLPLGVPWLPVVGAVAVAFAIGSSAAVNRGFGRPMAPSLLAPIGSALMAAFFLRSGYLAWRRGGIAWRGTLYPTAMLRAGARLEPPWSKKIPLPQSSPAQ